MRERERDRERDRERERETLWTVQIQKHLLHNSMTEEASQEVKQLLKQMRPQNLHSKLSKPGVICLFLVCLFSLLVVFISPSPILETDTWDHL